jgi:DNA-binding MarR family transcriptional regulator
MIAEQSGGRAPSILEEIKQVKPTHARSQEAYLALLRTADEAKRHLAQVLESAGVTLQQYNVLRILRGAGRGGLPTLSVADRMLERTPGVTRLIDRMEKKGWVTRERCTEDRRRVWCKITKTGLDLLAPLDVPVAQIDRDFFGALQEREIDDLIGYLDRIRARLKEEGD